MKKSLVIMLFVSFVMLGFVSAPMQSEALESSVSRDCDCPELDVDLEIIQQNFVGMEYCMGFLMQATATGGAGSYTFTWSGGGGAHPKSAPNINPNRGGAFVEWRRYATAYVTVTSCCHSVTKSILLDNSGIIDHE